jgi:cytochrome c7-like protein
MTRMRFLSTRLMLFGAFVLFVATVARAQPMTRCAACHFANLGEVPSPQRLAEWQQSSHARHVVGCHECHGGDPWTYVPSDAHRGVLGPAHPLSPVNNANLTRTCARCHQATAQAFSSTLHETLVQSGDHRTPNCTTCHGVMRAAVPSPAAVEARCAECHRADSPRGEYPALMRTGIEALNALRARADALGDAVALVPEHGRRVELLVVLYNVRKTLKESVARVHAFDVQELNERLAAARREIEALERASVRATDIDR